MGLLHCSEDDDIIELISPVSTGERFLFGVLGLVPLLAPYELLLQPRWSDWRTLAFAFALLVSLGALSVSALLFVAAVAGLEQRMRFELRSGVLTYTRRAPWLPERSRSWRFSEIERIELVTQTWSDGPDSHAVKVVTTADR